MALARGDGTLVDWYWVAHGEIKVEWTADGQTVRSRVRAADLQVVAAGVCVSGHDQQFDLTSLCSAIAHKYRAMFSHEASSRGECAMRLMREARVTICGVGALGGNLAEHLARSGWRTLRLVDDDRVAESNLACQPYSLGQVGQPKAQALAATLRSTVGCTAQAVDARLTSSSARELLAGSAIVVDAMDNAQSRLAVRDACRELRVPCLHLGLSHESYADLRFNAGYDIQDVRARPACAVPYSRSLILMLVGLAGEALIRWLETGLTEDREICLESLWESTRAA